MSARLTVLVPVFDEAHLVGTTLAALVAELPRLPCPARIVVLNDGSRDWSEALERRLTALAGVEVRSFAPNAGKGAVLSQSFPTLTDEFVAVIDADGEYPAHDLAGVVRPLIAGEADFVLGSRYGFGRDRPRQSHGTYAANRLINAWFRLLSGARFRDLMTGLFACRAELLRDVRLNEPRFSYTPELIWRLLHRGDVRWAEVPVDYRTRGYAEGKKIRWWETATVMFAALRYKFAREQVRV